MDKYEVKITDEALADMEKIYEYIAIQLLAPENAMEQYNRIADAILTLDSFTDRMKSVSKDTQKLYKLYTISRYVK